jgi:hypothetical protein
MRIIVPDRVSSGLFVAAYRARWYGYFSMPWGFHETEGGIRHGRED